MALARLTTGTKASSVISIRSSSSSSSTPSASGASGAVSSGASPKSGSVSSASGTSVTASSGRSMTLSVGVSVAVLMASPPVRSVVLPVPGLVVRDRAVELGKGLLQDGQGAAQGALLFLASGFEGGDGDGLAFVAAAGHLGLDL